MTISSEQLILNPDDALRRIMNARKKYLDKLTSPITQGKDGRWFTRVPDPSKGDHGRRMIRGNSEEEVENKVIKFFMDQESENKNAGLTVADCWQRWYDFRLEHNKSLSPSSFQIYRQCWKRYFEGTEFAARKITKVNDLDIEAFMISTIEKRGMNRKCAQELAYHLRNIFRKSRKDRIINDNPWDYVDLQDTVYPACRFRRTVESGLRMQGKSGEAVGHMLGHSSDVGARFYAYDMKTVPAMQQAVSRIYSSNMAG